MSVFTVVTPDDLAPFLQLRAVGDLLELKGISAGVTNTNYFVTTTQGRYVLTLFETLRADELPFYVDLMSHLAHRGVAVARPIGAVETLCGKPALLAERLSGTVVEQPSPQQCHAVGVMLARMHLAAADYPARMPNPRGPAWWTRTVRALLPQVSAEEAEMLRAEVALQQAHRFDDLPAGVVHADLFRDNVLMDGERVGGFIDFFYACNDALLFDLAIAVNDWCPLPDGDIDAGRVRAMLAGYQSIRALTAQEKNDWPVMLRAAALRFWVSRLLDYHRPSEGEMVLVKDPDWFRLIIAHHAQREDFWL
ncbi:homoserine kinase [Formivibrio citricus]|uniref:Homoserine kinase n=1 Tax=Formivibrio citricus TaxID=83765 RepID=A0A1I5C549_9NEIS|nr:homoserine kinase [Formivibrio citricus]SFN81771.1 homoserine kinase [Formivibrio citricus]